MGSSKFLLLDTASPIVSIALSDAGEVAASRTLELRRSSEGLLRAIEEVLEENGNRLDDLDGIAVLRGPGSFTGLRIGLATVLGLHQALGVPATGLETASVLALAGRDEHRETRVVAAVDALRGEWWTRVYDVAPGESPRPAEEGRLRREDELAESAPCRLVGFGIDQIEIDLESSGVERIVPPPLARAAAPLVADPGFSWDATLLTQPIYQRLPAVNRPKSKN